MIKIKKGSHSANNNLSPVEFEKKMAQEKMLQRETAT